MITALAHACYTVRDLDASVGFYVGTLGLQHAFDFVREDGERFGVYLHVGGRSFIELFVGDVTRGAEGSSYRHLCLEVDDLPAMVALLRSRGVEITDPLLGSDHSWQAWLTDPDGNLIELHQYTPHSRQGPFLTPGAP